LLKVSALATDTVSASAEAISGNRVNVILGLLIFWQSLNNDARSAAEDTKFCKDLHLFECAT
jgi:hypothetical protein